MMMMMMMMRPVKRNLMNADVGDHHIFPSDSVLDDKGL